MLNYRARVFASACLISLIGGCSSTRELGGDPALAVVPVEGFPTPGAVDTVNRNDLFSVGPYDKLTIEVFGMPELVAKEILVDPNGSVSFPLAGSINVTGLTPGQIEQVIGDRLVGAYVRQPKVTVNVVESVSHAITIDGQVKRPGQYPVAGGMTLMRSMALAQGVTDRAKLKDVVVFRTVAGKRYAALYNLAAIRRGVYPDPDIYANDVIMVADDASRQLFRDLLTSVPAILTPIVVLLTQ